ncbi:chromosome segregation protein SMC [Liquorilactobacillus capillatus]|uniref:Chromosome partition protein Smc n=1 Tax=Liquorilactobacillus capillatus DSM 19910 TaxID=1423731 RepID=A0A0R1LYH0_9LACO|nr:chromosome segregation protein SMC [Liquorilactobacillus capillatus]KRL00726.1 chromosome partition protein [Liquorilactobacillus capillatus DSM 19910]
MKLKSLVINGFKSFADKTEINFQPGMTAIVGPNGSGKSNIIEAIRWVLGEQSAKSLRGGKMPDVIFAGSAARAALNRAEVLITFDNHDRYLKIMSDEVTVARRIYRDGNSEFLINGKQVRLKDIINLFIDTGLGRESFSIISQGRVEAIFNSKPQERRTIIEEVAGVSKYKKEKQKAEDELTETEDHLERIADIITELEKQREPLKRQSSVAKDYMAQKKAFDHYNVSRLVREITHSKAVCSEVEKTINEIDAEIVERKKKLQQQQKKVNVLHNREQQLNQKIDQLQELLVQITQKSERLSGQKNMSQQELRFQETRQNELKQQITENQLNLAAANDKKKKISGNIQAVKKELEDWQTKVAVLTKQTVRDETSIEEEIEQLRLSIIEKLQLQVNLKNKAVYLEKEEKRHTTTNQVVNHKINELQRKIKTFTEKKAQLQMVLTGAQTELTELNQKITEDQLNLTAIEEKSDQRKRQWYSALEVFQKAQAQYESLRNITANRVGYYFGVKEILKKQRQLGGIVGPVADILNVPAQIAHAVEMALGGQLQNIVVTDQQAAKRGIAFLTANKLGRVTFLPRPSVRRHILDPAQQQALNGIAGVLGVASQLVSSNNEADRPILEYLLGTTVIVKEMDDAIRVERSLRHGARIVTLAGNIINPGGSMTGGSTKQQRTGLLEQKQRVTQLAENLKIMKEKMAALEVQGSDLQAKKEKLRKTLLLKKNNLNERQKEFQEQKNELSIIQNNLKYQKDALKLQQGESADAASESEDFAASQSLISKELAKTEHELAVLRQRYATQKEKAVKFTQITKQNEKELQEAQQQDLVVKERLQTKTIQLDELNSQIAQLEKLIAKGQKMLLDLQKEQSIRQLKGSDLTAKFETYAREKATAKEQLEKCRLERKQLHGQVIAAENSLERLNGLQELVFDKKRKQSIRLSHLNTLLDQNLTELTESYHLTYEEASRTEITENDDQIQHKLKLLKLGISELGAVNLGAIDEYERVDKRYNFLSTQQKDLIVAKEQLHKSMFEMDNEVQSRFEKTFKEVAKAFGQIFPQIFDGGRAALKLTAPDDLLTTGIEIMAQPQGKKLQQLSLLSGGEKALTAITLLFAILKVKPVPFVILDEAEAALDDANVERYSRYLRNFHEQTQFIVITHRKGTMEHSDILYGITMQESGISNTVSVSLEKIS